MRLLATILSVYIVFLAALPCIDEPEDHSVQKNVISQQSADSHQNEQDHCSPFCTCQCCATPVVVMDYTVHFECFSYIQKNLTEYKIVSITSPISSIWQPPKIG
jgi:hypothetical protein